MRRMVRKRRRALLYAGAAALAIALLAAYLLLWRNNAPTNGDAANTFAASESATSTVTALGTTTAQPPNSTYYKSATYRFSLYYPSDLAETEHIGTGGTTVVLFQNQAQQQGFQIFIAPYDQPKITEQRFQEDEPSGVMDDPQNITLDGVPATAFSSENSAMGTSVEIWFLHGGFLYEVTAPQALAAWLFSIMETWTFT